MMVRNFSSPTRRPPKLRRSWRQKIGPGLSNLRPTGRLRADRIHLAVIGGHCASPIKLDSPGPIFCRHERPQLRGASGRTCLKFRTIMHDPQRTRSMSRQDTHFTRVGSFLRYIGVDGLPQLVNVLRGELTLIGDGRSAEIRL